MNKRSFYRVGVAGVGGRGLGLARYCTQLSNARLVAVADPVSERLDKATHELGEIARYDHHSSMLADRALDLDVVVVATIGLNHLERHSLKVGGWGSQTSY